MASLIQTSPSSCGEAVSFAISGPEDGTCGGGLALIDNIEGPPPALIANDANVLRYAFRETTFQVDFNRNHLSVGECEYDFRAWAPTDCPQVEGAYTIGTGEGSAGAECEETGRINVYQIGCALRVNRHDSGPGFLFLGTLDASGVARQLVPAGPEVDFTTGAYPAPDRECSGWIRRVGGI